MTPAQDKKNTLFIAIVGGGFVLILLLWLPTFVTSIQSITQDIQSSATRTSQQMKKQSNDLFSDTNKKLSQEFENITQEQKKEDALRAKVTDILRENLRTQQPPVLPTPTASSSPPSFQIIP